MKKTKKFINLLLALVMMFSMTLTVFAEGVSGDATETKGSITINNTVENETYSVYRIFDLESFSDSTPDTLPDTDGAYSYKVNENWAGFINSDTAKDYVTVDANGYVTWNVDADATEFAAAAIKYATAESTKIAPIDTETADNTGNVVFTELDLGYYLVDSTVGALCGLTTTNPDATVIEKNSRPTLEKDVKEDSTSEWGVKNDAAIGETVEFKVTVTVQGYAKGYVVHDVMSEGLTFESNSVEVYLNPTYDNATKEITNKASVLGTDYTIETSVGCDEIDGEDTCTFHVVFTDAFCESLKSGDIIEVFYNAVLNENAQIAGDGNPNKALLEYKDKNGETNKTESDETKTFTWEFPVLKYANMDKSKPLAGAEFSLYEDEGCTKVIKFTQITTEGETTVYKVDTDGTVDKITTDATGKFEIKGLDAGTYYLKEVKAPIGYNKLDTVVTVNINHDGQVNAKDENADGTIDAGEYVTEIGVNNNAGTQLPETGGTGTTIFYLVGGVLVIGAVVLLVTRKRMSNEA